MNVSLTKFSTQQQFQDCLSNLGCRESRISDQLLHHINSLGNLTKSNLVKVSLACRHTFTYFPSEDFSAVDNALAQFVGREYSEDVRTLLFANQDRDLVPVVLEELSYNPVIDVNALQELSTPEERLLHLLTGTNIPDESFNALSSTDRVKAAILVKSFNDSPLDPMDDDLLAALLQKEDALERLVLLSDFQNSGKMLPGASLNPFIEVFTTDASPVSTLNYLLTISNCVSDKQCRLLSDFVEKHGAENFEIVVKPLQECSISEDIFKRLIPISAFDIILAVEILEKCDNVATGKFVLNNANNIDLLLDLERCDAPIINSAIASSLYLNIMDDITDVVRALVKVEPEFHKDIIDSLNEVLQEDYPYEYTTEICKYIKLYVTEDTLKVFKHFIENVKSTQADERQLFLRACFLLEEQKWSTTESEAISTHLFDGPCEQVTEYLKDLPEERRRELLTALSFSHNDANISSPIVIKTLASCDNLLTDFKSGIPLVSLYVHRATNDTDIDLLMDLYDEMATSNIWFLTKVFEGLDRLEDVELTIKVSKEILALSDERRKSPLLHFYVNMRGKEDISLNQCFDWHDENMMSPDRFTLNLKASSQPEYHVPDRPDVSLAPILTLFDKCSFTVTSLNDDGEEITKELPFNDDGEMITKEKVRDGLAQTLKAIGECENLAGTPLDPNERKEWWSVIHNQLADILVAVEKGDIPEDGFAAGLIDIGIAGRHCGTRMKNRVDTFHEVICRGIDLEGETHESQVSNKLSSIIHTLIDKYVKNLVDQYGNSYQPHIMNTVLQHFISAGIPIPKILLDKYDATDTTVTTHEVKPKTSDIVTELALHYLKPVNTNFIRENLIAWFEDDDRLMIGDNLDEMSFEDPEFDKEDLASENISNSARVPGDPSSSSPRIKRSRSEPLNIRSERGLGSPQAKKSRLTPDTPDDSENELNLALNTIGDEDTRDEYEFYLEDRGLFNNDDWVPRANILGVLQVLKDKGVIS